MQGIFDPRWVYHHRDTVESAALATIRITRPNNEVEIEWEPDSGDVLMPETYVLYEGSARWQKNSQPTKRDFLQDTANFQRVLVQVSIEKMEQYRKEHPIPGVDMLVRPNDRVELVVNTPNTDSEGSAVYVWGNATSSNPWHHTFKCQENMKQA